MTLRRLSKVKRACINTYTLPNRRPVKLVITFLYNS